MTHTLHNRLMAPVYAFVFSLGFVVILGTLLDDPMQIKFVIAGKAESSELPEEFKDFKVRVHTDDGKDKDDKDKKVLADKLLGRSPEFTLLNPHKKIQICTDSLPRGWFAKDAVIVENKVSCVVRDAPDKPDNPVVITLSQQAGA